MHLPLSNTDEMALVDDADYSRICQKSWWKNEKGYVVTGSGSKVIRLHRVVLGAQRGQIVDHRDGNKLDNRKSNLRICTALQNGGNRKKCGPHPYMGISPEFSYTKGTTRWSASAHVGRARKYLGAFATAEDAARAYDDFIRPLRGEFGSYNFPRPGERSALTGEIVPPETQEEIPTLTGEVIGDPHCEGFFRAFDQWRAKQIA